MFESPTLQKMSFFCIMNKIAASQDLRSPRLLTTYIHYGWILQVSLFQTPRQGKAKMPCNHLGLRHKNTKVKGATVYQ